MPSRVVVCGNIVFDILARPVRDVRWGATTIVEDVSQQLGGNAASTSYTLAKLGIPVSIATLAGRDAPGSAVLQHLAAAGADLSLVQYVNAPTSIAISLIRSDGERALLYQLGAASEDFGDFDLPADATHFHLAAVYRMQHLRRIAPALLKRAKEAGLTTSLDAQWDHEGQWMKVLAPSLPFVDYVLVNEDEARMLTGKAEPEQAAQVLRDRGASHIVIKLGARGCWLNQELNGTPIPGFPAETVDTTGAGDCFAGGFIAALQRGMSIEEAAEFANAVGALAVQQVGATAGLLDWAATQAWLNQRRNPVRRPAAHPAL